ncbi:MAG: hypothetical protein WBA63_13765 [Thermomicrobiales bacterium]
MINQVPGRRRSHAGRSQLATELLLTAYAAVAALVILRTLLVILQVTDRIWLGSFVFGLLDPVTKLLDAVPGSDRALMFGLTVADLTLLAPVVLFPLGLIATGGRRS